MRGNEYRDASPETKLELWLKFKPEDAYMAKVRRIAIKQFRDEIKSRETS